MNPDHTAPDPYRGWVVLAACAPPVLTIVALAYAPILYSIAPTLSVRTFLELSELKKTLPALAFVSYVIYAPFFFVCLFRRLAGGWARRVLLAVGVMLVLAIAALLLTTQSSSLDPFIYAT